MGAEIRRTVAVKLNSDTATEQTLLASIDQYRTAANTVVETAWSPPADVPRTLDRHQLHEDTYDRLRNQTDLHSGHVQLARDRAIEAMTAVVEARKRGATATRPTFTAQFLDFNTKTATINDRDVSLATTEGRVQYAFVLPNSEDTPHHQYLRNQLYDPTRSTLTQRDGEWYLNIGLKREADVEPLDASPAAILGIDLGISNVAVSSTGRFWSGGQITHLREEYTKHRRDLQRRGSRGAHEALQRLSRRYRSKIRQRLHTVANEIIDEAVDRGCPVIACEDLSDAWQGIQRFQNMRTWAYRRLIEYLSYKSLPEGITVTQVDPENTSKRCSTCGYTDSSNRTTQDRFSCQRCGYQNHADYNAAKNIGLRQLRRSQTGDDGGAPAGVRVNGGIVTHGGYEPLSGD